MPLNAALAPVRGEVHGWRTNLLGDRNLGHADFNRSMGHRKITRHHDVHLFQSIGPGVTPQMVRLFGALASTWTAAAWPPRRVLFRSGRSRDYT